MPVPTASLTDRRELLRGLSSVVYLLLPLFLAVVAALPTLLAGPRGALGARLIHMLVLAGILEGVFVFLATAFFFLTAAGSTPAPPWPLRPDRLFRAVRRLTIGEDVVVLRVGFWPFRRTRQWPRSQCRALRVESRPEGKLVGSPRRRFALALVLEGHGSFALVDSIREEWLRHAAYSLRDLSGLPVEDASYGRTPRPEETARGEPREPIAVPGFRHASRGTEHESGTWTGRHEIVAGLVFLGLLAGIYGLLVLLGAAGFVSEPTWVDAVAGLMMVGGFWYGILRKLLVHRLALDRCEVVYTLTLLGVPLRRKRLPLSEVEAVRLGFEEASFERLAPEAQEKVDEQAAGSVLDGLLERTLVIAGRRASIRIRGLPGTPARAFHALAHSWIAEPEP